MSKLYYFGYGMNTNKSGMATRCPGAVSLGHAVLPEHEFRFAYHADILVNPEFETHGVLWEIDEQHLASLDQLEGYPFYYLRKTVPVIHNNNTIDAIVYYMVDGHMDCEPTESYYSTVLQGYHEHNVPHHQLIEAIEYINKYATAQYDYQ